MFFFKLLTLFRSVLYLFQLLGNFVLIALCFCRSPCREKFRISESYHSLSFGLIVTYIRGICFSATLIKAFVKAHNARRPRHIV